MKGQYTGVVADYNLKFPFWKQFLNRVNALPVNRNDRKKAIESINKAEKVLNKGLHIAILPEGTRTINGKLGKLKKGGFHLAVNTKANILPILTKGLFKIKPINRWTIKPGIIEIHIKEPIITKGKTVDELLEETRTVFLKTLKN